MTRRDRGRKCEFWGVEKLDEAGSCKLIAARRDSKENDQLELNNKFA